MSKTLPLVASLLIAFGASGAAFAQDTSAPEAPAGAMHGHHQPDPERQTQRLTKLLNLTPDQSNKIAAILQQRQQQFAALKSDSGADPMAQRQKMHGLMQSSQSQIEAVLTDSQRQQWQAMRDKMRQKWQDKKSADNPG
jgi:periplasmic protein CpxP/Spy